MSESGNDQPSMSRYQLLSQRSKAKWMMNHPLLPQHIKDLAKQAVDLADVSLGMRDAMLRKQLKGSPIPIPQSGARPLPKNLPAEYRAVADQMDREEARTQASKKPRT